MPMGRPCGFSVASMRPLGAGGMTCVRTGPSTVRRSAARRRGEGTGRWCRRVRGSRRYALAVVERGARAAANEWCRAPLIAQISLHPPEWRRTVQRRHAHVRGQLRRRAGAGGRHDGGRAVVSRVVARVRRLVVGAVVRNVVLALLLRQAAHERVALRRRERRELLKAEQPVAGGREVDDRLRGRALVLRLVIWAGERGRDVARQEGVF